MDHQVREEIQPWFISDLWQGFCIPSFLYCRIIISWQSGRKSTLYWRRFWSIASTTLATAFHAGQRALERSTCHTSIPCTAPINKSAKSLDSLTSWSIYTLVSVGGSQSNLKIDQCQTTFNQSINQSIVQEMHPSVNQSIHRSRNAYIGQSINQSMNHPINK